MRLPTSKEWQAVNDKEYIKLLIADARRVINDILARAVHYNPLNPDAALDDVYRLAKQGERDLDTLYGIFLEDWAEAVKEARQGQEFEGEEADDLELYRSLLRTKQMGDSSRGRWRKRSKTNH